MGKKRKELSHEEIWDDTGLIDSWDQSYEEYKLYHSIHARGERVEDVLRAAEEEENQQQEEGLQNVGSDGINGTISWKASEQNVRKTAAETLPDPAHQPLTNSKHMNAPNHDLDGSAKDGEPLGEGQSFLQSTIAQSSQDRALKNLMMSWYWAGYYTGLYEGQRQAATQAP